MSLDTLVKEEESYYHMTVLAHEFPLMKISVHILSFRTSITFSSMLKKVY
jgi:hypothetical protein